MNSKVLVFFVLFPCQILFAQRHSLTGFPKGHSPEEVGKLLAYHFTSNKPPEEGKWINYPHVCVWNGALMFAETTKDQELIKLLQNRFEPLFATKKEKPPVQNHVDWNMFGSLPLRLYQVTNDKRYFDFGLPYADTQWEIPGNAKPEQKAWAEKGYTWQTRLWIDDMYMITVVQTQAYKATGDMKYLDRAASEMVMYLDSLQQPNGLFYHAPDVPFYWGRGNGWMATGMTDLLRCLPKDHKDRPRILRGYQTMMRSLKRYQRRSGMWNQLLDERDCWVETSGSAMFTYAFITGVKQGWLPAKEYAPAARKAWMAMTGYINENGDVRDVCEGTNKKNDKQYYYDRARRTGDYHGQAPYLWCAFALLEN
jgi:unsaturated rhamnogalacturonyl hydrolase